MASGLRWRSGENFYVDGYPETTEGKSAAISDLRDILATLKWEIWESEPSVSRRDLSGDEWDEYIAARFHEWPYFNLEYIAGLVYKPKGQTTVDELLAEIQKRLGRSPQNKLGEVYKLPAPNQTPRSNIEPAHGRNLS